MPVFECNLFEGIVDPMLSSPTRDEACVEGKKVAADWLDVVAMLYEGCDRDRQ